MKTKKSCGPYYRDALETYAGDDPKLLRIFAAGFVNGQAEKVYLGACIGAMFRPKQDRYGMLIETVNDAAKRYGLEVVAPIGSKNEIWICRWGNILEISSLTAFEENSAAWHARRAFICGVPESELDIEFHLREGATTACD